MVDFYSALARKIQQVQDDPARMREVVYEAARLALRWQVAERGSLSNIADSRRLKTDLEEAIARLEAEATAPATGGIDAASDASAVVTAVVEDPEAPATPTALLAAEAGKPGAGLQQPSPQAPTGEVPPSPAGEAEKSPAISLAPAALAEAPDQLGKADLDAIRPGAIRPGAPIDLDEAAAAKTRPAEPARERVRPQRPRDPSPRSAYRVKPSEFANRDQRRPARSGPGRIVLGIVIALQLVVGALAAAALYIAMWGRGAPVVTASETPRVAPAPADTTVAAAPESPALAAAPSPSGTPSATAAVPAASPEPVVPPALAEPAVPPAPAQSSAPPPPAPPPAAPAPPPASPIPVAPAPRMAAVDPSSLQPPAYGVYALVDNKLVELQPVRATPVDPRNAGQLQILEPGRTVVAPGKPAFVVYRRELASHAPEKVPLRIAARVAHAMNFDSTGKAIMTTPATDTWIIREQGYDLRASPIEGNSEMIKLRADNPALSLTPGRYELMLGGQAYDLTVAGEVTDPAHCVEGVTTVRGQVFNECKPVL
jgi:hypothetical protein